MQRGIDMFPILKAVDMASDNRICQNGSRRRWFLGMVVDGDSIVAAAPSSNLVDEHLMDSRFFNPISVGCVLLRLKNATTSNNPARAMSVVSPNAFCIHNGASAR